MLLDEPPERGFLRLARLIDGILRGGRREGGRRTTLGGSGAGQRQTLPRKVPQIAETPVTFQHALQTPSEGTAAAGRC